MRIPAVYVVPASLTHGIPTAAECRAYDATLDRVAPLDTIALVWSDGTITRHRRVGGTLVPAGRRDHRCPVCALPTIITEDGRWRCEDCDTEACPDCGAPTTYTEGRGWHHADPATPPCFMHQHAS